LNTSFQDEYAGLSDQELLIIAGDKENLLDEAALALDAEIKKRGLTYEQGKRLKTEMDLFRTGAPKASKPEKSKYLADKPHMFWGLPITGAVVILYWLIVPKQLRLADEWNAPAVVAFLGTAMAPFAVRPRLRKQVSFWLAVLLSAAVQLLAAHWLLFRFPNPSRGTGKLIWAGSAFAGYSVGAAVYRLLQNARSKQEEEP